MQFYDELNFNIDKRSVCVTGQCPVPVRAAQCVDREMPHTWLDVNACQRASEPFTVLT